MSRALQWMTALCVTSLLVNVWLYRKLGQHEHIKPVPLSALPLQTPAVIAAAKTTTAQPAGTDTGSKLTNKQMMAKCRMKFEEDMRRQLLDPKQRESFKRNEIMVLQTMNVGAQERLQLSNQAFARILELQAEQNLIDREASIGKSPQSDSASLNTSIADEFGDGIAAQWANYQKEFRARAAVHAAANLLADANLSLTEQQKRKLTQIYADEYELEANQNPAEEVLDLDSADENSSAIANRFEKDLSRRQALAQRIQVDAASFLTPAQLEMLRKKSDLESEQLRSFIDSMPKNQPLPEIAMQPQVEC